MTTIALDHLHRIFDGVAQPTAAEWTPRADVSENEAGLNLQFDLPGVRHENLEVRIDKGVLLVKGERKLPANPDSFHRVERPYGAFTRVFALPDFINPEAVDARLVEGVLEVFLPRREESKPKQIQVKVQTAQAA